MTYFATDSIAVCATKDAAKMAALFFERVIAPVSKWELDSVADDIFLHIGVDEEHSKLLNVATLLNFEVAKSMQSFKSDYDVDSYDFNGLYDMSERISPTGESQRRLCSCPKSNMNAATAMVLARHWNSRFSAHR